MEKARAAAGKVKAEAAKDGISFTRAKQEELERLAQEEREWRARQATKTQPKDSSSSSSSSSSEQAEAQQQQGEKKSDQGGNGDGKACGEPAAGKPVLTAKESEPSSRKKYEGASAGESPLAAAARALLERTAPGVNRRAGVEVCSACGMAGAQLGYVDATTGNWLCQHCGVPGGGAPAAAAAAAGPLSPADPLSRRGSTGDFSGSSSIEHQEAGSGHGCREGEEVQQKRRPVVRRRPQSAALHRSASNNSFVSSAAAGTPPFIPPHDRRGGTSSSSAEDTGSGSPSGGAAAFMRSMKEDQLRRWSVGVNGLGGSPKTSSELGFESRMRMMEMLSGAGGSEEQNNAQQAQAAALAKTLMHRGASREDAERSAARTVQSTSRADNNNSSGSSARGWAIPDSSAVAAAGEPDNAGGGGGAQKSKTKTRMRMRPQSAGGVPSMRMRASFSSSSSTSTSSRKFAAANAAAAAADQAELEAVMLETVGALTAERGRIAEQLAWAHKTGSSTGLQLAERMQAAEDAVAAATRVLAQPRGDRSSPEARQAGGAMIKAAQALRQQVSACRDEQLARMSPRSSPKHRAAMARSLAGGAARAL